MLNIVRSNCNSIPQTIPANSPAWLEDIHQKLADPLNASNRIYRIVPTSRRRKFLTRHLAQSAKIIPQIITLDQWINELSAQGLLGELTMMTETQRHLVLAKAWHQTTGKEAGAAFLTDIDRIFRDFLGTNSLPDENKDPAIFNCFKNYLALLKSENFADRNTQVMILHDALAKNQGPTNWLKTQKPWFLLEGFHLFQPLELKLIQQVARHADVVLWLVANLDAAPAHNVQEAVEIFQENGAMSSLEDYFPPKTNPIAALGNQLFQETGPIHDPVEAEGLQVFKCGSALAEVEALVRWLKRNAPRDNAEFRKIAVVIPGEPYGSLVREVFTRSGIPFNLAGKGFQLAESRPVRVLQAALDLIQSSWTREELSGFLHLPFVLKTLNRPYFVEEVLRLPVSSPASLKIWREAIARHALKLKERSESLGGKFQSFVASLEVILKPVENLETELGTGEIANVIRGLFAIFPIIKMDTWLGAKGNINKDSTIVPWTEIEKDQKSFSKLRDILKEVLLLGDRWLPAAITNAKSPAAYAQGTLQLLQTLLADRHYQVTNDDDAGVQVFEGREIQGLEFETVFALGLVSGKVPSTKGKSYLARLRQNHDVLKVWMQAKHREEKYLFTQLFEAASKNLILSYPVHDEEKELIPSLFIKPFEARALVPSMQPAITCSSEKHTEFGRKLKTGQDPIGMDAQDLNELKNWPKSRLLEEGGVKLPEGLAQILQRSFPGTKPFSPSSLEAYSKCAFRFFANNLMRLLPFEDNEATLLGKLVHKALFTVYNNKRESLNLPANSPLPALDKKIDRVLLEIECRRLWQDANEEFAGMIRIHRLNLLLVPNGVLDVLLEWLENYEEKFGFITGERDFAGTEIGFDTNGVPILLAGRADRIDGDRTDPSNLALVDFKTGKPNKDKVVAQTADGRLLQLPLYAITTINELMQNQKGEIHVASAKYLHLADTESSSPNEIEVPLDEKSMEHAREIAIANADGIRRGRFSLSMHRNSKTPECMSYCSFGHACRQPAGLQRAFN
ncbi:MAG: exodeoxyribonuclease V subunit gamma [Planctomycetota bacterium]|nr:exodeoxyribonuclease V subunit gamma [Planctomycetota bacterium]